MAFDAGKIEGTIDLDLSPFQRRLGTAKTEARRFAEGKYSAKIDADSKQLDAKIIDIRSRLGRLGAEKVSPTIDLDGFAAAEARIKLLQAQLDRLGATRVSPTAGGGGRGGGPFSRAANFGRGGFFGGMGLLGVAGGSAALPLGVGALGVGASFLTPTVAGLGGLGLFGGASHAAISRVEDVQKKLRSLNQRIANTPATKPAGSPDQIAAAQARLTAAQARLAQVSASDTGTPAQVASARASVTSAQASLNRAQGGGANPEHDKLLKQREQLLKKLTPAERDAAKNMEGLEDAWKHFQRAIEPQTFKALASGTDFLRKGLHLLLPMTKAVGDEVDDMAKRADKALDDPFWKQFFGDFLTREAPRAVDTLGRVLGSTVSGIAHLSEQFAPLGHSLEDNVVRWSGMFDKWSQGGGPQRFMDLVERDGPVAARALDALAHGLGGLFHGLEPLGRLELQALTPILNFIGELGEQHPEVITALGGAYLSVAAGLKAIGAANRIGGAFGGGPGGLARAGRTAAVFGGVGGAFAAGQLSQGIGNQRVGGVVSVGGGALAGAVAGSAFGPEGTAIGAVIGAAGGALVGLASHIFHLGQTAQQAQHPIHDLIAQFAPALVADKGKIGPSSRQVVQTFLQGHPFFTGQLASHGITQKDLMSFLRTGTLRGAESVYAGFEASGDTKGQSTFAREISDLTRAAIGAKTTAQNYLAVTQPNKRFPGEPAGWHPPMAPQSTSTTVYDLRGSTFTNVNSPHDLERSLKGKQRQSQLGPGVSIDNANRMFGP